MTKCLKITGGFRHISPSSGHRGAQYVWFPTVFTSSNVGQYFLGICVSGHSCSTGSNEILKGMSVERPKYHQSKGEILFMFTDPPLRINIINILEDLLQYNIICTEERSTVEISFVAQKHIFMYFTRSTALNCFSQIFY